MSSDRKTRKIGGRIISIKPQRKELPARDCACGCNKKFVSQDPRKIYFNRACANRAQQKKLRARARIGA